MYITQGLGELLHLAVGKNQFDIVKYLIEHHNLDPTCAGQVRTIKIYILNMTCMCDWVCENRSYLYDQFCDVA